MWPIMILVASLTASLQLTTIHYSAVSTHNDWGKELASQRRDTKNNSTIDPLQWAVTDLSGYGSHFGAPSMAKLCLPSCWLQQVVLSKQQPNILILQVNIAVWAGQLTWSKQENNYRCTTVSPVVHQNGIPMKSKIRPHLLQGGYYTSQLS